LALPAPRTSNLVPESYRLIEDCQEDLGVETYLRWLIEFGDDSKSFTMILDKSQAHYFNFTCTDRTNPTLIRLIGSLQGSFKAIDTMMRKKYFLNVKISIDFAYPITF
jgi:hypothetical protein